MKVGDAVHHIDHTGQFDVGIIVARRHVDGCHYGDAFEVLWCEGVENEVFEDQLEVISESW